MTADVARAPSAFAIAAAGLADLDEAASLFDLYGVFYRRASNPAAARAFLAERLARRDSAIFLARDAVGQAVGFMQLYPSLSSAGLRRIWILNDLYVALAARRRGLGGLLLDHARDFAKADGALRLELSTERTNSGAQALYRAAGWVQDEVFVKFTLPLKT